jgi:hypothetical protein
MFQVDEDRKFLAELEKAAKEAGPDGTVFVTSELNHETIRKVFEREIAKDFHVHDFGGCGECVCGAHRDPRLG